MTSGELLMTFNIVYQPTYFGSPEGILEPLETSIK